tara:strand:+ start:3101 stop:3427 length:327 start_codon:yes stop_codon:yes gene_type:complete
MASNKLEEAAIAARQQLLTNNTFNNFDLSHNYSATHTNAKSDDITPIKGKGTGVPFDSTNGGGHYDIYGHPNHAGSGRIGNTVINQFNSDNAYTHPDTTGNVGQVTIE